MEKVVFSVVKGCLFRMFFDLYGFDLFLEIIGII